MDNIENDLLEPIAGPGHNRPPEDEFDKLVARVNDLVATANRWATERPVINDGEIAAKCQDFLDQIGSDAGKGSGELGKLEASRKAEKRPHIEANAEIDKRYEPLKRLLNAVKAVLAPRRADWLRREQARIDEERRQREAEAQRKLQEAEEARRKAEAGTGEVIQNIVAAETLEAEAATALKAVEQAPARAQVRGEYGRRSRGLRTVWYAEVTNYDALYLHLFENKDLRAEMVRLANAEVRAGARAVPGCDVKSRQE
jgi:hypothetical protein